VRSCNHCRSENTPDVPSVLLLHVAVNIKLLHFSLEYAGRIRSVRTDNSTFERVEEFKYLGANLTNQNSIPEEIKGQTEARKCLLSFGAEPFVFQVAIQKFKDQDI